MITNYLIRQRQNIAILMLPVFVADFTGVRLMHEVPQDKIYVAPSSPGLYSPFDYGISAVNTTEAQNGLKNNSADDEKPGKLHIKDKNYKVDIGGPGQPEMHAFQSVGANNMVDLFSGDFSYSIPLLDVGGYPVGLAYRGGASMDQEASWVGLGWNINPGTIMRNTRGLPDDFNGKDSITKELNTKTKWTAGVNVGLSSEIFGSDNKFFKKSNPTIGLYYDNYTGPGFRASLTPGLDAGKFAQGEKTYGIGEFGLDITFDSKSGFNINPSFDASLVRRENGIQGKGTIGLNYNSRAGLQDLQVTGSPTRVFKDAGLNKTFNSFSQAHPVFSSTISFSSPTFTPTITMPTTFAGFTFTARAGGEAFGFHPNAFISGFYNQNYIAKKDRTQKLPAYGFLHMTKSINDQKGLLDFNREKDIPYRKNVPNIAVPFQTYDVFSISGEGIGGSFRAYRGDGGYMHDHEVTTKSYSANAGADFGIIPNLSIAGADVRFTYAFTVNKTWEKSNVIKNNLLFKQSDSTYEAVYFRNPGEQSSNTAAYYQSIGDDDLVRVNLVGDNYDPSASNNLSRFNKYNQESTLAITTPVVRSNRDKRSQVINYLTAAETMQAGLEKEIRSYPVNVYPLGACDTLYEKITRIDNNRKEHHISEITVLNPDGRRYVYGIPAYNLVQKEATFAVDKANANTTKGLVGYNENDLSTANNNGKDGYFNLQTTPAHAHSYLLTSLMSTDYVDVTGNGITDDDLGDAVKFNYSRMKWGSDYAFKWRTPTDEDKASYDEGLRTDNSDDKAHIVYGEKEIWYLNSVESKTMIATFKLDTDSLRKDGFEVKDIHGGRSTSSTKKLMRLKEINLYSKADLKKYGSNARPVKTVHFSYSYRLCKGYPDLQDTATGKLTLESVWFTYNKVKKGKDNPYVFTYGNNPAYKQKAYDRWGNYKPNTDNPSGIPSDEYPYAIKDSAVAAQNAGAWALTEIKLPSGAKMKVQYESDDYGFVQNKRANEMFRIAGFGTSSGSAPGNNHLYQSVFQDKRFVFVSVPVKVATKSEVREKYIGNESKLYFRLHVKMPHDSYGSGYEYIPVYADINDYGRVNDSLIWIELKHSPEGNDKSPLATAAIQFLRLNLPSKAYPGSDVRNNPAFVGAIQAVLSIVGETMKLLLGGFNNEARIRGKSKEVMLDHSFVRLSSPGLKKYGGGYRVKKITIHDNWQKMTGKKESVYGQEYEYTTTKIIEGKKKTISSGVASYEPSLGNEENPFHQPVEYTEKATLAPSNFLFVEEPFAESLFPSAGVGYSKVRVSSINRKNIKSAPGFEETEFYTAYDFPTLTQRTQFDKDSYKKGIDKFAALKFRSRKFITLSQGFKIELNDMHGKMKSSAVYSETDSLQPITYTAQYYRSEKINGESYRLVNTVPVIDSANGVINGQGQIGKDIELVTDMREQFSSVKGAGLKYNGDNFILPLPFLPFISIPTAIPEYSIESSRYRSVAMLKIIQRYGIIDSVVHIDKGSKVSTRNMVWDGETGEVLLTQTQNEFNDPVYQFQYPAHWAYSGAGSAYKNIDAVFRGVCINGGKVVKVNGSTANIDIIKRICESGDEILVLNKAGFHTSEGCMASHLGRETVISPDKRIWVVDKAKVSGGAKELYFIGRDGSEYTGHDIDIRVIRSGRRNIAAAAVGSVVSLKTPVKTVSGVLQIVIDSTIDVVATGAVVMKDVWSAEDRLYKVTTCDSTNIVKDTVFSPAQTGLVKRLTFTNINGTYTSEIQNGTVLSHELFTSSRHLEPYNAKDMGRKERLTRGLVKFDLSAVPEHAILDSATLKLFAKRPFNLWQYAYYWYNPPVVSKAHTLTYNQSELLQVTQPWSSSTTYQQTDLISIQTNKVILPASTSNCQDYNANVKDMVAAMISQPSLNYGMLFKLSDTSNLENAGSGHKVKHMSFCGNADESSPVGLPPPCDTCTGIQLRLKYHYRHDTCYSNCKSVFENPINPYVQGIWGNWRGWRSYVYYDRRKESDPSQPTNIRTQGVIKDFTPYWAMSSTGITATGNSYVWVWNSEITRYNRRGLETENHDPLGRFNSGLYGYGNTLPVAVTQNARHRETAFDGFEDYSFATDSCTVDCPLLRHVDFSAYKDSITTAQKHSGKSSLRVGAGSSASIEIRALPGNDSLSPSVSFNTVTNGSGCTYFDKILTSSGAVYPGFTPLPGKLMNVGAWVKEAKDCKCSGYTGNKIEVVFYDGGTTLNTVSLYPSGNIIEGWQRYDDTLRIPAAADSMSVRLKNTTNIPVYFDDLRIQPYNSNMKSFVYHPTTLKLLAELDENNYASFYEYDDEGTLIRVKKETERGIKTITETRSGLRKEAP